MMLARPSMLMASRNVLLQPKTHQMMQFKPSPTMLFTACRSFSTTPIKKKEEPFGFGRLTKHYRERKAMENAIEAMHEEMTYNHLPYGIRFFMFLNRIKFRLFVLLSLGSLFSYWGNLLGMATSKFERVFKKYKRRWIFKYNSAAMTYQTALDTKYEPKHLSR